LPEQTVTDFHRRYVLWCGFFENFTVDRGLDLRREFFQVLALSQDVAAEHGLEPRRLMPLWLSVCAESGDTGRYDASYLRVALLGLRRLPLGSEFDANEDFALQGLARWAVTQRPSTTAFEREWRILEGVFPRDVGFWTDRVQAAITAAESELSELTKGAETTFPVAAWWREDVDIHPDARTVARNIFFAEPVPMNEWQSVLRSVAQPLDEIKMRVETLMNRQRRYADVSGDVFYLVRTACNFGMRLIEMGAQDERFERGKLAVSLATLAFKYDPMNIYAWSLMRDALAAAGRIADAELVGWEAIRRFPEDCRWRNQLATVLTIHSGKVKEAVALLRETIALFPQEPYARTQLATVLADDMQCADEAGDVLAAAIAEGVANDATKSLQQKLNQKRPLRRAKPHARAVEDASTLALPTAMARRHLFLFEAELLSKDDLWAFLQRTPQDSYVTYVSERAGLSNLPFKAAFGIAFDDALKKADPSALRALIGRARPIERALVEEAIAVSEGRVVPFSNFLADGVRDERLQTLEKILQQQGGREKSRIILLRDFAASTLSASAISLVAA